LIPEGQGLEEERKKYEERHLKNQQIDRAETKTKEQYEVF
jgi:hypothetical protein